MMRMSRVQAPFLLCLMCVCALLGGCRDKAEEPTARVLDGVIEKIDLVGNVVTVRFYAEKQQMERKQTVHISETTEVMINGALARLEDVREGERARGEILIEKRDGDQVFTAKRVEIRRAEPLKPKPAEAEKEGATS